MKPWLPDKALLVSFHYGASCGPMPGAGWGTAWVDPEHSWVRARVDAGLSGPDWKGDRAGISKAERRISERAELRRVLQQGLRRVRYNGNAPKIKLGCRRRLDI